MLLNVVRYMLEHMESKPCACRANLCKAIETYTQGGFSDKSTRDQKVSFAFEIALFGHHAAQLL